MLAIPTSTPDYIALTSQCRTQNQFNGLHIDLENLVTPIEISSLARVAQSRQLPKPVYPWLEKLARLSPGLLDSPQRFERTALSENLFFYRDPRKDAGHKRLLVGFTGGARRLMMPIAIFLQALDSQLWDVVLLRKGPERRPYTRGLEGLSRSLPGVLQFIQTAVGAKEYQRVVTLGTSGGGHAALLAAILMDGVLGVSVGGSSPQMPIGLGLRLRLAMHQARTSHRPELKLVFGADCARDREHALSLQASFGGRLYSVAGVAEHNPFRALLARGEFAEFLREILG